MENFHELIGIEKKHVEEFIEQKSSLVLNPRGRSPTLSTRDQVLLFLLYFQYNIPNVLLGAIFKIAKSTATDIRNRLRRWFYDFLSPRLSLMTPDQRLANCVTIFGKSFTFVVDGSEQPVPSSSHPFCNGEFYSVKKGKPTVNILIVIHIETKRILFLSESCPWFTE